ncbi:hypothetical protein D3C86_1604800 [compost metagenome]
MADKLRSCPVQLVIRGLADFYRVIGNQTVSAFYKLKRCLTFTDTTAACNQHAHTVHITENAMNRGCRRQPAFQKARKSAGKYRGRHRAAQHRQPFFVAYINKLLRHIECSCNHDTRCIIITDPANPAFTFFVRQHGEKSQLSLAQQLNTFFRVIFKITSHFQTGTIQIIHCNRSLQTLMSGNNL